MILGALPTTDLSIAGGKPYTFVFTSWLSAKAVQGKMNELAAYANNITVSEKGNFTGSKTITITLVTLYPMPLSAWQNLFSGIGLSDMTDMYFGGMITKREEGFTPIKNISTYWEPKIKAVGEGVGKGINSVTETIKTVAIIAGAFLVGGLGFYGYMQGRGMRVFKKNPRRKR